MTVQLKKVVSILLVIKRIDIPLRIEKGKTASYIVKVDGKTVAEKEVSYDDV